ncbi:MAG: zf-HC2 domain-containing protein, partial [Pyrinomonadaceae bacterium]
MKNKELDNILDQVTAGIRSEQIDDGTVSEASEHVWARISDAPPVSATMTGVADRIEGCADFQSLIPSYLGGKLSEARSLLLVDHTHECIPCRGALKTAREGR